MSHETGPSSRGRQEDDMSAFEAALESPIPDEDRNTLSNNDFTESYRSNLAGEQPVQSPELATSDTEPTSPLAKLLRSATEKVAGLLDNRAATKDERVAARAETREKAKDVVKTIGRSTLKAAKTAGLVTIGITLLSVENETKGAKVVMQKIAVIAQNARMRFARRAADKENSRRKTEAQDQAYDSYGENIAFTEAREAQDEAFATYEPNVEYHQAHEEALEVNAHKKADQEAAYDSYADNIDTTQKREAQEAAYESYEDNISASEALERRRAALARKAARRAGRREKIRNGVELGKKGAKGLGRIALKALKATGRGLKKAASATVSGAKKVASAAAAGGRAAASDWKS